jgi:hypothetical protein
MQHRLGRLVVGIVLAVLIPLPVVVATVSTASAAETCEPTHPPADIQSLHALDVVPGTHLATTYFMNGRTRTPQRFRLFVDNPCYGAGNEQCPNDHPEFCSNQTYTYLTMSGQRTLGSGASCRFRHTARDRQYLLRYDVDPVSGQASYSGFLYWSDRDGLANGGVYGPELSNKCAGAYDMVVTIRNVGSDKKTLISGSNAYRQSHSFVVRRPSRLSTNLAASKVRAGSTVPVRGRLTRADWDKPRNPQTAYAGQRVYLQRATSKSGTYHTLKSVKTDRHGYAHTTTRALSDTRCYRFVFPTNSTTQRKVSAGDCVVAN